MTVDTFRLPLTPPLSLVVTQVACGESNPCSQ
jgi:hypothetical protein